LKAWRVLVDVLAEMLKWGGGDAGWRLERPDKSVFIDAGELWKWDQDSTFFSPWSSKHEAYFLRWQESLVQSRDPGEGIPMSSTQNQVKRMMALLRGAVFSSQERALGETIGRTRILEKVLK
jgi:hypothetical protein